jgi:mRNA-degrading endonuclease RelE of RelBE toxin-antitoxin system
MKSFRWEPAARADLRKLDSETAMRIPLTDRDGLYRLRVGKWRLYIDLDSPNTVRIHGIDNRGQAY